MSYPQSSHSLQTNSLRPRNKRLISGLDEPSSQEFVEPASKTNTFTSISSTPFESPFGSRAPSPIPSKHPSRSSSTNAAYRDKAPGIGARGGDQFGGELTSQLSGLWGKSWTSLQGIASNVLGSDETVKDKTSQRQRRPFEATHGSKQKAQWGPSIRDSSQLGAGSREERKVLVRERKRQELLMSNANLTPDALRMKRRTSDDFESASAPPGDNGDREALVYLHTVTPLDTLAGLSIKYNCPMQILKRSNRMYSDVVQTRKHIVLPVDACGVKGRPCSSPTPPTPTATSPKLGDGTADHEITPKPPQHGFGDAAFASKPTPDPSPPNTSTLTTRVAPQRALTSPTLSQPSEEDKPWKHDSWVHLDGYANPTEIVRLSRRDLGFFPRVRRKSVSYSDLDTPSASFDLPRPSITVSSDSSAARGAIGQHRKRGSSGSAKGATNSLNWAQQMSGPGGVGNLRGKGESAPGPAQDKFSRAVSKHLPSMAPPQEGVFYEEEEELFGNGSGQSLEQLGGAIEGWVRGLGKKVGDAVKNQQLPSTPGMGRSSSKRRSVMGVGGPAESRGLGLSASSGGGDLIELSNAFEIGEDETLEEERDEQRGRRRVSEGERSAQRAARGFWDEVSGGKSKGD